MNSSAFRRWCVFAGGMALAAVGLWGVVKWGSARMQASRTGQELHELSMVLEQIKGRYGGYPRVSRGEDFFDVLMGRRDFLGRVARVDAYFNPTGFTCVIADPDAAGNSLLDSWGRAYVYLHRPAAEGAGESFILYSLGPDGRSSDPTTWGGDGRGHAAADADNLYAK